MVKGIAHFLALGCQIYPVVAHPAIQRVKQSACQKGLGALFKRHIQRRTGKHRLQRIGLPALNVLPEIQAGVLPGGIHRKGQINRLI